MTLAEIEVYLNTVKPLRKGQFESIIKSNHSVSY